MSSILTLILFQMAGHMNGRRQRVLGQEDPAYPVALRRTGWEPVPVSRHPEMMPPGAGGVIERKGMVLMERPKEITDEMKAIDYRNARNQVRTKEQQLTLPQMANLVGIMLRLSLKFLKAMSQLPIPSDQ